VWKETVVGIKSIGKVYKENILHVWRESSMSDNN